ncbi:hypothetical protein FP744_10005205 [Trichoderma asperellum]
MPPPSLAQQKILLAQFVSLTGVSERQATRYLKSTGYKLNEAVDASWLPALHSRRRRRRRRRRRHGDDDQTTTTQQFRDACIPCIGPRMMLGWKGVKQHLPSKVAKAVPLLLSKKKREKHGANGSAKDDPGRYILLWMTGETGTSIKTEILHWTESSVANVYQVMALHHFFTFVVFAQDAPFYMNSANEAKGPSPLDAKLDALFDSLRDDENDEKDKLELESTMGYLSEKLNVSLENAELFVVLELVQAPSVGEITRAGFIDGWKASGAGASHQEHASHVRKLISDLSSDSALFKKVYRYAFVAGREKDQKSLGLENALIYWSMLFSAPGMAWKGKHDWLELWKTFLGEKWTRSVNRDMWNMILEFALKTKKDESLSFWSEDGAWPSVIDDFVEWCKQKGIGKTETMDVDEQ